MKFIHCSDIHLNFCTYDLPSGARRRKEFLRGIHYHMSQGAEFVLLTGDITEAPFLTAELYWLAENIKRPLYYLLGNHDYWYTDFKTARFYASSAQTLNRKSRIIYLPDSKPIKIRDDTYLIGINGWYDCQNYKYNVLSDFMHGMESLSDFEVINDLIMLSGTLEEKREQIINVAIAEVELLRFKLNETIKYNPKNIIIGTHIPPLIFKNSKIKENHPGFYSCVALLDLLLKYSTDYANIHFYVYCGHNHGGGSFELENLKIYGKISGYGAPDSVLVEI